MDTPIVVIILMIAVLGMAVGIMSYTAGMSRDRQTLTESRYAVTIMREVAGQIRSLAFEGQTSTTLNYQFTYGHFQFVSGGSTTVTLTANGEQQTLLSTQHSLLRYAGPYSMYGKTVYDGNSEPVAYVDSPFQTVLIYNCGGSSCTPPGDTSYSYTVDEPIVYVAYQQPTRQTNIQVYVFVLALPPNSPDVSPSKGQLILSGSTEQNLYTYNIGTGTQIDLKVTTGSMEGELSNLQVAPGDTVEVTVNVITVTVSFLSGA